VPDGSHDSGACSAHVCVAAMTEYELRDSCDVCRGVGGYYDPAFMMPRLCARCGGSGREPWWEIKTYGVEEPKNP
jgi:DnaJ-class molecular chaperone